jgi:hypothetical protein
MRTNHKGLAIVMLVLAGGFLYGLWDLYQLRFDAGDVYPRYSSLRADPMGAMAFYESIGQLPDMVAARNYLPLASLHKGKATVFFLGEDPFIFRVSSEDTLKEYEVLAAGGARVVIAMEPVVRATEPVKKDDKKTELAEPPAIEKRWGVSFAYVTRTAKEAEEESGGRPKVTALYFLYEGRRVNQVERPFGKGVVVLLANCYPMSNEALAAERETKLLVSAVGGNRQVIFDEHHLGVAEDGSVAGLARKYHLQGLVAALLLLLALFIWQNSTSFLPARPVASTAEGSVAAKDASSGLANLLRRNVPAKALLATCLEQWEKSQHGGRYYSAAKIERVRALARREGDPAETYRKVSSILAERSYK